MDKYRIIWSPRASSRLLELYNYLIYKLKEPITARNLYNKILYETSKLKCFPAKYPDLSYYGKINKSYRRLRVDKFIIIYKVDFDTSKVFILDIFHSNQNYLNLI